jgi:ubiquinone/menaquinone biosynthesis C-methylase UbiE
VRWDRAIDEYVRRDHSFAAFAAGQRVLDVGCGYGLQLAELADRGCRAFGVDVRANVVAKCSARGLRVAVAAAEALPFRHHTMDGVVCKVVLPYTDEARALTEIARVLASGGTLRV